MGFSGFEGRQHSLFSNHLDDFADAASLQALVTALAFRYIAAGSVTHDDIPDDPFTESERRQCIFASAIGVGTVNVREGGPNRFLARILSRTQKTRVSRRYAGNLRVRVDDYRLALLATLGSDNATTAPYQGHRRPYCASTLNARLRRPEQHPAVSRKPECARAARPSNSPRTASVVDALAARQCCCRCSVER